MKWSFALASTVALALALPACSGGEPPVTSPGEGVPIPADEQRAGDPEKGYAALVNEGYVSCGIPHTAYAQVFGPAPASLQIPGRDAKNEKLPYYFNRFTTSGGVDVVSANCLTCHAGYIRGELVIGLGDTQGDFTANYGGTQAKLASAFLTEQDEKDEVLKFAGRLDAIAPYTQTRVVGVNPADNLAAILFAHRDRKTLAWSDEPLLDLPPIDTVPVDVPPWWRMAKKNAMFYVGAGRGDHARIEMTASTLCTDSVEEAQKIDAYFPDIAAFIASIQPPKYPFPVDQALADEGEKVYASTCSRCHGTYGDDGKYPNLLIPLETIGTDPTMVTGLTQFADVYVEWFNGSFYGELSRLEPQQGYVAPPLDGIWATAPFLHNGSVPTIEALLDSKKRPAFWTRKYDANGAYDDSDYDETTLGWRFTSLPEGQSGETETKKKVRIYDTSLPGYGNGGHTFGDDLSDDKRKAVIEYLKTL